MISPDEGARFCASAIQPTGGASSLGSPSPESNQMPRREVEFHPLTGQTAPSLCSAEGSLLRGSEILRQGEIICWVK